jgi:hypothetical protein
MEHNRFRPNLQIHCRWIVVAGLICISIQSSRSGYCGQELLVNARRPDGTETAIRQKVIVTSAFARLSERPGDTAGKPLDAFAIFYRLKTDAGALEEKVGPDTYWRVGDEEGNPKGWIRTTAAVKTEDGRTVQGQAIREWNSRFVLDPQTIASPDKPFNLLDPKTKQVMAPYQGARTSGDNRALAFVLGEANEEEEYPVIYYIGKLRDKAADEGSLDTLGLDVAFVLEMTEYMDFKWDDATPTLELLRRTVSDVARDAEKSERTRGKVAFAVVQYQDTMEEQLFVSDVATDFVTTSAELDAGMRRLRPKEIKGDWPEDGIAGIDTAIRRLKWRANSSKHIILIGSGSLQTRPKGKQESQFGGDWNRLTQLRDFYGWSSTGQDIRDIVALAHMGGTTDLKGALTEKTLHAILLGRRIDGLEELQGFIDRVVMGTDADVERELAENENRINCFPVKAQQVSRQRAEKQYHELACNGKGELVGVYSASAPTLQGVTEATGAVGQKLEAAFIALESLLSKGDAGKTNEFSKPLVEIAAAYIAQFADKEVMEAVAAARNDKGREVAKLKVLVFQNELERLKQSLDKLYTDFAPRTKKADRQDVGALLKDLKQAIASQAAGQTLKFDEDTRLDAAIGDLPLKTPVLATTAKSLAAMTAEDFERWLGQLQFAKKRCQELLDSGDWASQSNGIGSRFAFLEQSQLP